MSEGLAHACKRQMKKKSMCEMAASCLFFLFLFKERTLVSGHTKNYEVLSKDCLLLDALCI